MGRPKRTADGGLIYHVLNRSNARLPIFKKEADYTAFEQVLQEAVDRTEMRLLPWCVLPNHWHLVVWPEKDGQLPRFTHLADSDTYAEVACPPEEHRQRARLPGPLQVLPRAG